MHQRHDIRLRMRTPNPDQRGSLPNDCCGAGSADMRHDAVVLRRESSGYNNTIRDLVGVDFNPSRVPEIPGGGSKLRPGADHSPMQVELYYAAARQILDRALVGTAAATISGALTEENTHGADRYR